MLGNWVSWIVLSSWKEIGKDLVIYYTVVREDLQKPQIAIRYTVLTDFQWKLGCPHSYHCLRLSPLLTTTIHRPYSEAKGQCFPSQRLRKYSFKKDEVQLLFAVRQETGSKTLRKPKYQGYTQRKTSHLPVHQGLRTCDHIGCSPGGGVLEASYVCMWLHTNSKKIKTNQRQLSLVLLSLGTMLATEFGYFAFTFRIPVKAFTVNSIKKQDTCIPFLLKSSWMFSVFHE